MVGDNVEEMDREERDRKCSYVAYRITSKSLKFTEIPVMHAEEEGEMSEADEYELALFVDS